MSVKNKAIQNPFIHYFGLGDFLYFFSTSLLFDQKNFIFYFIGSMIFSILLKFLVLEKSNNKQIPLAGFSAILLIVILLTDFFFNYSKLSLIQ
ncbi:hypothetical protein BWK62_14105 [Flavobacterium oreochromis]|uniref:Prepilin type IV endopeptidase peptidase domain-containing protein n=1 Tax=Flavobacterium columnare TaxID=996 RepID=A0A246G7L8_9FLAO|nr:hypothetical protein BWK62_14105 [Flavobacterium oreochromis]OWP74772.1 hypothetical protein BWG23_13025 [Flavobacterium oreochromis]POR23164.1 hypothetical protein BWK58_10235 [Flavobacterium columnare]